MRNQYIVADLRRQIVGMYIQCHPNPLHFTRMDKLANIIGARIGAYRKARGLTQEDLAGLSARSVFTISQIERGVNAPNLATLIDLAQALECGLDELVFGRSGTDQTKKTKEHVNLEARLVADIAAMDLKTLKATRSAISAIFEAQS